MRKMSLNLLWKSSNYSKFSMSKNKTWKSVFPNYKHKNSLPICHQIIVRNYFWSWQWSISTEEKSCNCPVPLLCRKNYHLSAFDPGLFWRKICSTALPLRKMNAVGHSIRVHTKYTDRSLFLNLPRIYFRTQKW